MTNGDSSPDQTQCKVSASAEFKADGHFAFIAISRNRLWVAPLARVSSLWPRIVYLTLVDREEPDRAKFLPNNVRSKYCNAANDFLVYPHIGSSSSQTLCTLSSSTSSRSLMLPPVSAETMPSLSDGPLIDFLSPLFFVMTWPFRHSLDN